MEGMGIFSFCRYDPGQDSEPGPRQSLSLHRSCKVMTHELGHLFGLKHCVYFRCLMNGSNHLDELDNNGLFLCPVCLAKLLDTFRWDLAKRYEGLLTTCHKVGCFGATELQQLLTLHEWTMAFEANAGSAAPGSVD